MQNLQQETQVNSAAHEGIEITWVFDAKKDLDQPFHGLITEFGSEVIMDLDRVVNETPVGSPVHAAKTFRTYSMRVGREGELMGVMKQIAALMTPRLNIVDEVAMVPPEAVFAGFERPRH